MVLVYVYGIPVTTWLFRAYVAGLPAELVDAAKLDGASLLGRFFIRALLAGALND